MLFVEVCGHGQCFCRTLAVLAPEAFIRRQGTVGSRSLWVKFSERHLARLTGSQNAEFNPQWHVAAIVAAMPLLVVARSPSQGTGLDVEKRQETRTSRAKSPGRWRKRSRSRSSRRNRKRLIWGQQNSWPQRTSAVQTQDEKALEPSWHTHTHTHIHTWNRKWWFNAPKVVYKTRWFTSSTKCFFGGSNLLQNGYCFFLSKKTKTLKTLQVDQNDPEKHCFLQNIWLDYKWTLCVPHVPVQNPWEKLICTPLKPPLFRRGNLKGDPRRVSCGNVRVITRTRK